MGVVQQSINSALGAVGQAAGIAKGVSELKKKNELDLANAKSDIAEGLGNIKKGEIEITKEEALSDETLKQAKGKLKSLKQQTVFNSSPQLLQKRNEAARNVEEQKRAIALQKKDFAARREILQTQRESLETKANAYGIDINELIKGGKK